MNELNELNELLEMLCEVLKCNGIPSPLEQVSRLGASERRQATYIFRKDVARLLGVASSLHAKLSEVEQNESYYNEVFSYTVLHYNMLNERKVGT